jgi:hypothetical protein
MTAAALLDRLESVRETGAGRWMARCPAHEDKTPSLSIARGEDRWLIHDFGGCYPVDVMRAIGLELRDLFDDRKYRANGDTVRPRLSARDALAALDHESFVVWIMATRLQNKRELADDEWRRLSLAVARIGSARALICPAKFRP